MNAEYDIFLLWNSARPKLKEVKNEIEQKFEIVNSFEIFWSEKLFTRNLSRFYGKKLPSARSKLKLCGKGSFIVYVVKDNQPVILENGLNKNMSGMKYKLRQILGDRKSVV